MPVSWSFADEYLQLGGVFKRQVSQNDADRQTETAKNILHDLSDRPGIVLADEVGMGKTFVAMAVIASVITATDRQRGRKWPVVVMVPRGLRHKWQRDWEQFKIHCVRDGALDWVRDEYAHTPTEFFRLLDDPTKDRARLIFITTGCFSRGLYDPYVKLAMLRLARSHTRMTSSMKRSLGQWATYLVRLQYKSRLTSDVVERLMKRDVWDWRRILEWEGILKEEADDPVPATLADAPAGIDWKPLCDAIRNHLPGRPPHCVLDSTGKEARRAFNRAWREVYGDWLQVANWRSPLLVLDEAHHAKNDTTRLAQLFRKETDEEVALFKNKFDRMLFLTATPFQLGHQELIRVLRSFAAVRWSSSLAPLGAVGDFHRQMDNLQEALDANRLAGRHLDRLWGKLPADNVHASVSPQDSNKANSDEPLDDVASEKDIGSLEEADVVQEWWRELVNNPRGAWEAQLVRAVERCKHTREQAEELLRPWLIRHNRSPHLPGNDGQVLIARRETRTGRAISLDGEASSQTGGLPLAAETALPFLLTARAQGQLAQSKGTRAFFAEGLASSYEAFHHTRSNRKKAHDFEDGLQLDEDIEAEEIVPTKWYESQIATLIPSRKATSDLRLQHPKINATIARALDLWQKGEKVLVFCFYRETAKSLLEHLREGVERSIIEIAGEKFGLDPSRDSKQIEDWLTRIARRLTNEQSPFYKEVRALVSRPLNDPSYRVLHDYWDLLTGVLVAYFRSPAFIARYLPLDNPTVRAALEEGESRPDRIASGVQALRRAVEEQTDASDQTCTGRIHQFLSFAVELAERAKRRAELRVDEDEVDYDYDDPLKTYVEAVSVYCRPRRREDMDHDRVVDDSDDGSYRVMPLVRMVYGDTKYDTRDRLMQAFNSPLFPEILVSSSVLGEGVDLHRFCRHLIHHDLCWNPSSVEQRTGRLDRIRCKAEVCCKSIQVFQPFLAGSADEKMFRVVRDRERWFQIVMGQKFEFDEAASDSIAARVPLPADLAADLTFDLRRWKANEGEPLSEQIGDSLAECGSSAAAKTEDQASPADYPEDDRTKAQLITCPMCGAKDGVPIVYGMPGPELCQLEELGILHLGGCCVTEGAPQWHCRSCQAEWRDEGNNDTHAQIPSAEVDDDMQAL